MSLHYANPLLLSLSLVFRSRQVERPHYNRNLFSDLCYNFNFSTLTLILKLDFSHITRAGKILLVFGDSNQNGKESPGETHYKKYGVEGATDTISMLIVQEVVQNSFKDDSKEVLQKWCNKLHDSWFNLQRVPSNQDPDHLDTLQKPWLLIPRGTIPVRIGLKTYSFSLIGRTSL